jgi:hypothetical protein
MTVKIVLIFPRTELKTPDDPIILPVLTPYQLRSLGSDTNQSPYWLMYYGHRLVLYIVTEQL